MSTYIVDNFINGEFKSSNEYIESFNPATRKKIADIGVCSEADVDAAVQAAKDAFPSWSALSYKERGVYVNKLADLIEKEIDVFAFLESIDQGKSIKQAREMEMPRVLLNFRTFADSPLYMEEKSTEIAEARVFNISTRSPVGVAAIITPWNLPLYLLSFKLAPCIMYGNTCVCKPSEFTSLTAWKLCELIKQAGFPNGVVNVVFGDGPRTGNVLVKHKDINLITFTGSTATGEHIQKVTTGQLKKLSFELGGKNAAIVFQDADFENSIDSCIRSSFLNQGEVCLCTSRIYVQNNIYEEFLRAFVEKTRKLVVGNPLNPNTFMGPVISQIHMDKILRYITNCKGRMCCGYGIDSIDLTDENKNGLFIPPTVFADVPEDDALLTDEVFGPVTAIIPFKTTEEAIRKVNSVDYGLCAVIHTKDQSTAISTARQLDVGTVWVNCWLIRDLRMPFGGCKKSGIGREGQNDSRDFFTETKTICLKY